MKRRKYDFEVIETIAAMIVVAGTVAVAILGMIALLFDISVCEVEPMAIIGWTFGLTGLIFSGILIGNWNHEKH